MDRDTEIDDNLKTGFKFVYPFGTSMRVDKPSYAILTSGSVCYPANDCLFAHYKSEKGGNLFVSGSY